MSDDIMTGKGADYYKASLNMPTEIERLKARIVGLEAENKYLTELNADVYVQGVERGEAKSAAQIAELEFRIERLKRCLSMHVMPAHADEINKEW